LYLGGRRERGHKNEKKGRRSLAESKLAHSV
jgi:hypothetical protein